MSLYLWRVLDKAWNLQVPSLGLHFFPPIYQYIYVYFSCWLNVTSQDTHDHDKTLETKDKTKLQYLPLEKSEIRLFVLSPGSNTDVITGHIEHSSWGDVPYEALSYVWGDVTDCGTILVDGQIVSVTKSLETALHHLRDPDKPRILWVDYICIDQENIPERNQQVTKMGSIYESAGSVLIWLGHATPNSRMGMEILRYFANAKRPEVSPVWQTSPQLLVYEGLQDIMTRPWFERMWVVQEVGLSNRATFLCGQDCVTWQSANCFAVRRFVRMIKYAEILPQWAQMGLDSVNMRPLLEILDYQDLNQFSKPWGSCDRAAPDLLDLAYSMRHKKCTDPRDKVFAIWGLVEYLASMEDFRLDYSMTIKQVYEELARVSFPHSYDRY